MTRAASNLQLETNSRFHIQALTREGNAYT